MHTVCIPPFNRPLRLLLVVVASVCVLLPGASAGQSPSIQVVEADARGMTIEVEVRWDHSLSEEAARFPERELSDLSLLQLSRGALEESKTIELPAPVAPSVQVMSSDYDEIRLRLDPESDFLEEVLGRQPAEVVQVGIERRRPAGTFVARFFAYDPDTETLRRYRRMLARVQFRSASPEVSARMARGTTNPHVEVTRSVLADGVWFKVPVQREGVYRIDRAYLEQLGAGADVDLSRVQVYGNGGMPLPALNSDPRPADLVENATWVEGNALYFYGRAPRGWRLDRDTGSWEHYINPFTNQNYYFIRINQEEPRRVQPVPFPGYADAERLERYDALHFIHEDIENLGQEGSGSGLEWLGPRVDVSFPNRVLLDTLFAGQLAGEMRFRTRFAVRSNPAASIRFRGAGNEELGTFTPGSVILQGAASTYSLAARAQDRAFSQNVSAGQQTRVQMSLVGTVNDPQAWLDWMEIRYPRNFSAQNDYLKIWTPEGRSGRFEMVLTGFSSEPVVWDISQTGQPRRLTVQSAGNGYRLQVEASEPRKLLAFTPGSGIVRTPQAGTSVPNQNLHGLGTYPDFVIVTPTEFRPHADELAEHRRREGLVVEVAEVHQIYNEFSGGVPDMRAVRDYFRFIYDRAPDEDRLLRYALLFGGGHYDIRGIESQPGNPAARNWIFPFQTDETLERMQSYTSDDYFALLSENEGRWTWTAGSGFERADIGIGRLPVQTAEEAALAVRKIKHYEDPTTYGSWRTRYTFVADDHMAGSRVDYDLHTHNAEAVSWRVEEVFPEVNIHKLYAISYDAITTAQGRRNPAVTNDIMRNLREGTLLWNYAGHGGWAGLADERIFMIEQVQELDNWDRLATFITATCSFGKWDMNDRRSGGEELLINPRGGAVALFTTTRIVYTSWDTETLNVGMNRALNLYLLSRGEDGLPRRMGEAYRLAKNTAVGASGNNRKFSFLGDPTMRIGIPVQRAKITRVNGEDLEGSVASMKALGRVELEGRILNPQGDTDVTFDGLVELSVYDASRDVRIAADRTQRLPSYPIQTDLIHRGRVSVNQGTFTAAFVVPKDISYSDAPGKISIYASGQDTDAFGGTDRVLVGGTSANPIEDNEGPEVHLYLNDTTFVPGGMTGAEPLLIVRLFDESGINTVGTGVGHEMLLVINEDERNAVDIGSRFVADLDSYQSGEVRYQLPQMPQGPHMLSVKAWDILNNSSLGVLDFYVVPEASLALQNVFNYPNPMSRNTRFVFEHNQPAGTPARIQLRVYTVNGRPIRTIDTEEALPGGTLPAGPVHIPWDGRDQDFDLVATGVYLYKLRVEVDNGSEERQVSEVIERLVIIR